MGERPTGFETAEKLYLSGRKRTIGNNINLTSRTCSLHMLMGKQMIRTVLIISVTLAAEPEFQIRILLIGPAADGAFMLGDPHLPLPVVLGVFMVSHSLFEPGCGSRTPLLLPDEKEDQEV